MTSTLLCAIAVASANQGGTNEMRLMRFPDVHGDTVVFTYAGDLWTCDLGGGLARRLTTHNGMEQRAKFSPDGNWIAFTGEYDGNTDVYVVPTVGGEPKRLTYVGNPDIVLDWTPDGKIAYKSSYGSPFTARLWTIDPSGGLAKGSDLNEVGDGSFSPDGGTFAYNRSTAHQFNWRRYRGGTQGKISFYEFKTNRYWEIPSGKENSWFPMWVGNSVYFISDKNQGTVNLYKYDVGSKAVKQVTNFGDADIKWPATDGKTIVYERDGYLYSFNIAESKSTRLNPRVLSDNVSARAVTRNVASYIDGLTLSPSGLRVAVAARGDIFSLPAKSGETRNMTESSDSREMHPAWSPDGKTIAYFSDKSGEMQVYTQPQMGGEEVKLTSEPGLQPRNLEWSPDGKYLTFMTRSYRVYNLDVATKTLTLLREPKFSGNTTYDWSPDSKWIAYIDGASNFLDCIWLYEVGTGKRVQVTDGFYNDNSVAFDRNGKYLYFTSQRTFFPSFGIYEFSLKVENATRMYAIPLQASETNPLILPGDEEPAGAAPAEKPAAGKDLVIDTEGMAKRAIALPMGPGNYSVIAGLTNSFLYVSPDGLFQYTVGTPGPTPIVSGPLGGGLVLNANRTKFAYLMQGQLGIANLAPGFQVGQGRVGTAGLTMTWDPEDEWKQMFWEAWRFQRDNFYDKDMLGLNWKAIGDRYAKYLPYVKHKTDFNYVLGLMIGELGTGHAYVSGGEIANGPSGVPTGHLGVDYEAAGSYVKFAKIYRGENYDESLRGPLGEPGLNVKEGDFLLEIDGKPVRATNDPHEHLIGKVGRTVVLTVNSTPSMTGARKIRVRPVSVEANLRYSDWVETNRKLVSQLSGGKIGYMHIPNTSLQGAIELIRGFYSQVDKEAMLIDERYNGGGYIQPWFVETLARKTQAWIQQRHFADAPEAVSIEGPKALLINGYAGSGGDFFPWMFKQNKLGPLIGTRTWGGLVGISGGAPLMDGTSFTSPEFGIYDHKTGKWIAENMGVDPDIEVDARPDQVAQGKDPQLEAGVKYLLDELKKKPNPARKRPDFIKVPPAR